MTYTVGELFAGIGGFSLAFHATGQARTAWFVEKEPYCQKVLNKNFPGVPVYGDIYECRNLPHVDIITAGFPCQPFSVAGKREGENDERYLVPEMFRVIQEVQPYVVVFENVAGFTNIANGDTFKQFLRTLAQSGYHAQWGHIRASDIGAPHRRERWFCVAYTSGGGHNGRGKRQRGHEGVEQIATKERDASPEEIAGHYQNQLVNAAAQGLSQPQPAGQQANQAQDRAGLDNRPKRSGELGNTTNQRPQRQWAAGKQVPAVHGGSAISCRAGGDSTVRQLEPGFCRSPHGLSHRLDGHQWPARPGQPQHEWEPPRTTSDTTNRTARLKALGNAVVPQVVYPIAQSICEWLDKQNMETGDVA